MSELNLFVDYFNRTFTDKDGGELTPLPFVLADKPEVIVRPMDRRGDLPIEMAALPVRSAKLSVGPQMTPPTSGTFRLKVNGTLKPAINWNDLGPAVVTALGCAEAVVTGIITGTGTTLVVGGGCWMVRFAADVTVEVPDDSVHDGNLLLPMAFVRVRQQLRGAVTWYEIRLIQQPYAFQDLFDRVLPPPPVIDRVRSGQAHTTDDAGSVDSNEIQRLIVPIDFNGAYYIKWNYRTTKLLGPQNSIETLIAAMNDMFADGATRFIITNPATSQLFIEFVGDLSASPQPLAEVVVFSTQPGKIHFALDLGKLQMVEAMRQVLILTAIPFELELRVVDNPEDLEDLEVPDRPITFQMLCIISREQIFDELAMRQAIEWQRPGQPVNYVPYRVDQVITGTQYYVGALGDGALTTFVIDHNLHTTVQLERFRFNVGGGRQLKDTEYTFYPGADSSTVVFAYPPGAAGIAYLITSAGPASVFQAHTHTIGQIIGLQEWMDGIEARIGALEDQVPSGLVNVPVDGDTSLDFPVPDSSFLYPPKVLALGAVDPSMAPAYTFDQVRAISRSGLLPAIHQASVSTFADVLPTSPALDTVYKYTGAPDLQLFGGLGRKSTLVHTDDFVAWDGRVWYVVHRSGTTTSYFPSEFEFELIPPMTFEPNAWLPAQKFQVEFDLLAMVAALPAPYVTDNAQWMLLLEHGTAPQDTSPATPDKNLQKFDWNTTAMLAQRMTLSRLAQTRHFGCAIMRSASNVMTAAVLVNNLWSVAASCPATPGFIWRARLGRFDTEDNKPNAAGVAFAKMTQAKASIS